jgi:hypothetical protein
MERRTTLITPLFNTIVILLLLIPLSASPAVLFSLGKDSFEQPNLQLFAYQGDPGQLLPESGGSTYSVVHLPPPSIDSWTSREPIPSLRNFSASVQDGKAKAIRGVYVPGFMALTVVQQPSGNSGFVSTKPESVTQFQLAARNGVTGFLAHNYLSGKEFFKLRDGLQVLAINGDGSLRRYRITGIYEFQKLTPGSNWSHYLDLQTGERLTTYQVFNWFYQGEHHLTFQTCLERDGIETWGLRFVVAEPFED